MPPELLYGLRLSRWNQTWLRQTHARVILCVLYRAHPCPCAPHDIYPLTPPGDRETGEREETEGYQGMCVCIYEMSE